MLGLPCRVNNDELTRSPISEHSINRNTEVDLASRVPLTALITGALAQALRMVLHAPAELATQCGATILNAQ